MFISYRIFTLSFLILSIYIYVVKAALIRVWPIKNYPSSLPVAEFRCLSSRLGRRIPASGYKCLLVNSDNHGCFSNMKPKPYVKNWTECWAVMVYRRGDKVWNCPFHHKFNEAHRLHYNAIIVHEAWGNWPYHKDTWVMMGKWERDPYHNTSKLVGCYMKRRDKSKLSQYDYSSGHFIEFIEEAWVFHMDEYDRRTLAGLAIAAFLLTLLAGSYLHGSYDKCFCECDCPPDCNCSGDGDEDNSGSRTGSNDSESDD